MNQSKKTSSRAAGEGLASQFELKFTLIACIASTVMGSMWYLELSASFHMTECRYFFSDVEEKCLYMHIDMMDDRRYSATGIGTITLKKELGFPLRLKGVMFIPGLKKNIISIAILEDQGYDVIFSKSQEFLRFITMV